MRIWLSASHHSMFRSPPGRWPGVLRPVRPLNAPATVTAHAPVPQAIVAPLPRSPGRMRSSLRDITRPPRAVAALPGGQGRLARRNRLRPVCVDASRERRVMLRERADAVEVEFRDVVNEAD